MDQKLKQIEQLLTLVDERDLSRLSFNRKISELIAPTMLMAIVNLLDLPLEQIEWVDVDVSDTVLVLTVAAIYNPSEDKSLFLRDPNDAEGAVLVQKNMRIGIPLSLVFAEPEEIMTYLRKAANIPEPTEAQPEPEEQVSEPEPKPETTEAAPSQFDSSSLTKDQVQQMLMFQHLTLGTKQ